MAGVSRIGCAVIRTRWPDLRPDRRVALRVGVNLDDIIVTDDDVFGDGVNIAARLEALAEPGSIYVSEIVRDRVAGKVDFDFVALGPKNLKNISEPIRVYRMGSDVATQSAVLGHADAASPARSAGIARASTFTFKGKGVDIKKVGEQLGARYIVEGSVSALDAPPGSAARSASASAM
jgi:hypothetical protein